MSETITEPVIETPEPTSEPVATTEDTPLGAPGLAALQAERDARTAAERRLKEFEDRDKTEAEKTAERLAAAEKRAEELEVRSTRAEVAALKSVPTDLLAGPASGSAKDLAAYADALIQFRGEPQATRLLVPKEGNSPTTQPNSDSEFVKTLFTSSD